METFPGGVQVLCAVQTHSSFKPQGASGGLAADFQRVRWKKEPSMNVNSHFILELFELHRPKIIFKHIMIQKYLANCFLLMLSWLISRLYSIAFSHPCNACCDDSEHNTEDKEDKVFPIRWDSGTLVGPLRETQKTEILAGYMQGPRTRPIQGAWIDKHRSLFSLFHHCDSLWDTSNRTAPKLCFLDQRETFISSVNQ